MDEAGEKFLGQCGTSSASGKKIPIAFDLPLDLSFLPSSASVWRDLATHEDNVSTTKKLRKTFGAGINALLPQPFGSPSVLNPLSETLLSSLSFGLRCLPTA